MNEPSASQHRDAPATGYARYALAVLVAVYILNFLDRQILAILAERVKADLGATDAQMGYLYGTVFAVFYAVFGIPLGRLADVWDRRKLITLGLTAWSAMTALSGLARSFPQLALARIGVGVGEASANPAAYSLLADTFPPAKRATALAVYSGGIYLGGGLGLGIGGLVVARWDAAFAAGGAPFGLHGWQVAFLVVGLPGLMLALWVRTLREPVRGGREGVVAPAEPRPFREFWREFCAVMPPLTLLNLWLRGGRARSLGTNLAAAALVATAGYGLTRWLGNPAQWIALGLGVYSAVSWAQGLRLRDRPTDELVLRTRSFLAASLGCAFLSFGGYSFGFWIAPFLIRTHHAGVGQVGVALGSFTAVAGWAGVVFGGWLADRLRRRSAAGRLDVLALTAVLTAPFVALVLTAKSLAVAYLCCVPVYFAGAMWLGPGISTIQDLVLPRMRASASAFFLMLVTFIGLALGPYIVGRISQASGSLRLALFCMLGSNLIALAAVLYARRHFAHDESTRLDRARAAGEPL
jgi:MFS family permease